MSTIDRDPGRLPPGELPILRCTSHVASVPRPRSVFRRRLSVHVEVSTERRGGEGHTLQKEFIWNADSDDEMRDVAPTDGTVEVVILRSQTRRESWSQTPGLETVRVLSCRPIPPYLPTHDPRIRLRRRCNKRDKGTSPPSSIGHRGHFHGRWRS